MSEPAVDLDFLLKLRLAVGRFGEMDMARWWNTKGQLSAVGSSALRRGFPRTHQFAQARSVFAVAAHRCSEIFQPPNTVTLWSLPPRVEDQFETRWEHWLDHAGEWHDTFRSLESPKSKDLQELLQALGLAQPADIEQLSRLKRSAEGRAVVIPGTFTGSPRDLTLLALGFARGEPGALAVPYMQVA